jgi:hypothetical protein
MLQLTSCEVLQFFSQVTGREQESQYFIVLVYHTLQSTVRSSQCSQPVRLASHLTRLGTDSGTGSTPQSTPEPRANQRDILLLVTSRHWCLHQRLPSHRQEHNRGRDVGDQQKDARPAVHRLRQPATTHGI